VSRRDFFAGVGAVAASSVLGCSHLNYYPIPISSSGVPLPPQPVAPDPVTPVSVTISSTTNGTMPPQFIGLSYEKANLSTPVFSGSNANLIALFKRLGKSVLRIGGNSVDKTNWNLTGPGQVSGETAPSDIAALAAFLSAVGWPVIYGVNFAQSTPAIAASEAANAAQALGSNLLGIEIGNEVDNYGFAGNYFQNKPWSFSDYIAKWQSFASAISAQTPGVALTGPAIAYNTSWFSSFAQAESASIVLLTAHYYRDNGLLPSSTIQELISYPDQNLQKYLSALEPAAHAVNVPYRIAETNSFYNGGAANVSDSYASALWVIDHLFTIAQAECAGVNLHGGGNSNGYTPIADNNGVVVEARPEYYGVLLCALAGQGPLLTTTINAGSLNATAYTVQTSPTGLSLIIVNKDVTQNLHFTASCPGTIASAALTEMTASSLSAISGVTIQGSAVNPDGSFSPQSAYGLSVSEDTMSGYVPAESAVLVAVTLSS
jgi:hypothetical protein